MTGNVGKPGVYVGMDWGSGTASTVYTYFDGTRNYVTFDLDEALRVQKEREARRAWGLLLMVDYRAATESDPRMLAPWKKVQLYIRTGRKPTPP